MNHPRMRLVGFPLWLVPLLLLPACGDPCALDTDGDGLDDCSETDIYGSDPALTDTDGDGLSDGDEVNVHGTDPISTDSDGDGTSDADEIACGSDATDSADFCYACGWPHNDPGDLVSTGSEEGDVVANLEMVDQCGEAVDLWDLADEYHILFMTASW